MNNTEDGWKIIEIHGDPYTRGLTHGKLLYQELAEVIHCFPFILKRDFKTTLPKYLKKTLNLVKSNVMNNYPEFYKEIEGIAAGAASMNVDITVDFLIGWNTYISMFPFFKKGSSEDGIKPDDPRKHHPQRCSAFIATGDATKSGEIVMAHNTHTDFITGKMFNIVIYVYPDTGHSFCMQTSAGFIASVSDWFLSSSGIIGCETTISGINYIPEFGDPFYCRIRQAIQYGNTLDDYVKIMLRRNAGDYACSWQFGDTNTNEIMLFEIGLRHHSIQRTKNGIYFGMNLAMNRELRIAETIEDDFDNIATSVGARKYRLYDLLINQYYGKITTQVAKTIISDHYDMMLQKTVMNSRGICKHMEMDPISSNRRAFYPFGCTDGKVIDTKMAKKMRFEGRFGSACGRHFSANGFIRQHPEYKSWQPYLSDFPTYPWKMIKN
jgi:hypothetical protein